jgi:hypothetical protein
MPSALESKKHALAAFRRKVTYAMNRPSTKLQQGHGLTIEEMNAVLEEQQLPPVSPG